MKERELRERAIKIDDIDVFEQEFPQEGIMLMSQFNQAERKYNLGRLNKEDWDVKQQEIANSLLKLSDSSTSPQG